MPCYSNNSQVIITFSLLPFWVLFPRCKSNLSFWYSDRYRDTFKQAQSMSFYDKLSNIIEDKIRLHMEIRCSLILKSD